VVARTLDTRALSAEVSLMTGARLRSARYDGVGSRSADKPLPLPDTIDKWYQKKHSSYRRNIARALRLLERAAFEQSEMMLGRGNVEAMHDEHGAPTDAALRAVERATGQSTATCANCGALIAGNRSDRVLAGRCRTCYEYRRRHNGIDRPRELWDAA
jgi:hypothetical protein